MTAGISVSCLVEIIEGCETVNRSSSKALNKQYDFFYIFNSPYNKKKKKALSILWPAVNIHGQLKMHGLVIKTKLENELDYNKE